MMINWAPNMRNYGFASVLALGVTCSPDLNQMWSFFKITNSDTCDEKTPTPFCDFRVKLHYCLLRWKRKVYEGRGLDDSNQWQTCKQNQQQTNYQNILRKKYKKWVKGFQKNLKIWGRYWGMWFWWLVQDKQRERENKRENGIEKALEMDSPDTLIMINPQVLQPFNWAASWLLEQDWDESYQSIHRPARTLFG